MKTRVIIPTILALAALPAVASAYNPSTTASGIPLTIQSGEYKFRVNSQSMVNNLSGLSLTTTAYESWAAQAASVWRSRTGADIDITYDGSTTTAPCPASNDGTNIIGAVAGCAEPGCWTWATAFSTYYTNTGYMADTDICVYGGSATWEVRTDVAAGEKDLVGVLVHEIGHALGVSHSNGTVMQSNTHSNGNVLSRYPYGDDIEFARDTYGIRSHQEYFKEYDANTTTWDPTYVWSGVINMAPNAAIGRRSDGSWNVMRAKVNTLGDTVHFTRATYPLSTTPVHTNRWVATDTWRSPSVAARNTTSELWAAVWPLAQDTLTCSGAKALASSSAFDGATIATISDICTIHQIGITYDPSSGRFILAYVGQYPDGSAQESDTGRVFMRTSTNGYSWSAAGELDTGIYATTGPSLACRGDGSCVLGYTNGQLTSQYDRQRAFTVSAGGTITLGSSSTTNNWLSDAPQMATSTSGSPDATILELPWPASAGNIARGFYYLYSGQYTSFPVFVSSWVYSGDTSVLRPAMASNPGRYRVYSFFAK